MRDLQRGPETVVQLAQDRVLGSPCVLKFSRAGTRAAEALAREAELLRDLEHPNLVQLVDAFDDDAMGDWPHAAGLVTAWVDGEPLTSAAAGRPLAERLLLFAGLVQVVAYLHLRGVLHLDIKPANVLVGPRGVVLLDLGTALPAGGPPVAAGGTLGYVAPEVLSGAAPSEAADVYGLGAVLYEMLAEQRVFGDIEGRDLRQAVLTGEPLPLRVMAAEVPRQLATLVDESLSRDPAQRPRSVAALLQGLRDAGVSLPATVVGAPPMFGRDETLELLDRMLESHPARSVAVVGPVGSGRSTLLRAALSELGACAVDLSIGADPLLALHRLLSLDDRDMPPPGDGWVEGVLSRLERTLGWKGVVILGPIDGLGPDERAHLDRLMPPLAKAGLRVLVSAERPVRGARPLPLGPLDAATMERLGRAAGAPAGSALTQAVAISGGLPGPLLRSLFTTSPSELPPVARAAMEALGSLPAGIPRAVYQRLPPQEGLRELVLAGLARWHEECLYLDWHPQDVPIHPDLVEPLRAALRKSGDFSPLWVALALARLGEDQPAAAMLDAASRAAGTHRADLEELLRRLAAAGVERAQVALAGHRMDEADHAGVLAVLEGAPDTPDVLALRIKALRLAGRFDEARAVATKGAGSALVDVALVSVHMAAEEFDAAQRVLDRVDTSDPAVRNRALSLRVYLAKLSLESGREVRDLAGILEKVERAEGLSADTLSAAGGLLIRAGQQARGEDLLEQAWRTADAEGRLLEAATGRLNHGITLVERGVASRARTLLAEAVLMARAASSDRVLMRLLYYLVLLEIRADRLPQARQHLSELAEMTSQRREPGGGQRVDWLMARLALAEGRPRDALSLLEDRPDMAFMETHRRLLLARACLEVGEAGTCLELLEGLGDLDPEDTRQLHLMRGRAHLAMGRIALDRAYGTIPHRIPELDRLDCGEVLLAWGGEDLDPGNLVDRKDALDRATELLRGERRGRAATLRDRILDRPGAALEGIAALTEAMGDPRAFPEALAALVAEALGAHRVLIMMRLPGLGRQVSYRELSGQEAAGIGAEVLRRIQEPEDVWMAADAFADPRLREASATVRTFEIRSLLAVAIPLEGKAIGALYVDDLHRPGRFTAEDVSTLQRLGRAVAWVATMPERRRRALRPTEMLGLIVQDRHEAEEIRLTLDLLRDGEQSNLLLTGPTGAGKSWFARRVATEVLGLDGLEEVVLHGGNPEFLLSLLGGTRAGDYTGAVRQVGAIQRALEGRKALFLDEVQALEEPGQEVLLPLLELPRRRFGGLTRSAFDVPAPLHVILATNVEVHHQRWRDHFRSDLWYRMSQSHVHLPPLRERGREAVYRHLAGMFEGVDLPPPEEVLEVAALQRVNTHRWEGNLRELDTFARRVAHHYRRLGRRLGPQEMRRCGLVEDELSPDLNADTLESLTVTAVMAELERCDWNQRRAARALDIHPSRLNRLLKRHGLQDAVRKRRGDS